jgi:Mycobacterial 4 TMS phage holin, superfamily IV
MIRFLIGLAISVGAAAVGLIVAASLLDRMSVDTLSLLAAIFAVVAGLLGPFVARTALRSAPAVMGGIGLITTFIALVVTVLITDGLSISGFSTWVLATLIVWVATLIATLLIPWLLLRAGVEALRDDRGR